MSRVAELVALLWAHQHTVRKAIERAGVADADKEDAEQEALTGIAIGEKFIEIAKRTGTPIGSVAGRVGRVRAELRKRRDGDR